MPRISQSRQRVVGETRQEPLQGLSLGGPSGLPSVAHHDSARGQPGNFQKMGHSWAETLRCDSVLENLIAGSRKLRSPCVPARERFLRLHVFMF